ncbi:MAG TPA: anti-sigma factor [Acidimicrobiia bacterium]|nr:anti-sigma factor [Acidimicrobiia bacterium]
MSQTLSHQQIEELLGAFALDAVDDDERDLVEAHLAGCPRCRAEVAGYRETASKLAHTGTRAPDGLWERIAESIEEAPPALNLAPVAPVVPITEATARRGRRSVSLRAVVTLAAVAAAVTAFLGLRVGELNRDLDAVQEALSAEGLQGAALAAMGDPHAENLWLRSGDGGHGVRVVRLADGTGYVVPEDLDALPAERTYQLWGITADAKVSLAVLGNDPDVASFKMVGRVLGYAITEEQAGGVVASTQSPVVLGWIDGPPPQQSLRRA